MRAGRGTALPLRLDQGAGHRDHPGDARRDPHAGPPLPGAAEGDAFLASLGPEGPGETDILIHIRPERWLTMEQE